jgi:hypothetical protein
MKNVIALMLSLAMSCTGTYVTTPVTETKTIVTKIHEDDQITILTNYKGRVRERMLHGYDFNIPVVLSENIPTEKANGKFVYEFTDYGLVAEGEQYYQFESYDGTVKWVLTENDIGFVPSKEKEYVLIYCENGTTQKCECEVYDDIFIEVYEEEQK